MRHLKAGRRLAGLGVLAIGIVACGGGGNNNGNGNGNSLGLFDPTTFNESNVSWLTGNVNAQNSSPPSAPTGTLILLGDSGNQAAPSAADDPQGEYDTSGFTVERAFTRQLVSYASSSDMTKSQAIVADVASDIPTPTNGGKTYTFHLRTGDAAAMWDTTPPRPVTSKDFVLGLKRICDPDLSGNGNPGYYMATIQGFSDFCTPFENMSGSAEADRKTYIQTHNISGISTPDDSTLVINLNAPAVDFLNIMALPFASAEPQEILDATPLVPPIHYWSDGPYSMTSIDVNTGNIELDPNPAWKQSQDPIRHQYVAKILVKGNGASGEAGVEQQIEANTADLSWDTTVPTADLQRLISANDPRFGRFPAAGTTNPYLVFNMKSTAGGGALQNVKVRQALEYAVNKQAIGKIYGGPQFNLPLDQVLGPGAQGYQPFNDYPTPNDAGDPNKCKQMLQQAGVTNLTLTDYYRSSGKHPAIFTEIKTDFAACGVTVNGVVPPSYYSSKTGIGTPSSNAPNTRWDITEPGWVPDWFGPTNARSILPPLFQPISSSDWGKYDNPALDTLITQAETAPSQDQASQLWHQADQMVMGDAPFIPFQTQLTPLMHSSRVHNAIFLPYAEQYDVTQIWLSA